jgi:transposase/quinol monooxygenase YgiN
MIIRVFRARLRPGQYSAFARLTAENSIPHLRAEPGLLSLHSGRSCGRTDDYVLVTIWRDLEALTSFTGERWQEVVIQPGEADLLTEATVAHYDESFSSLIALRRTTARAMGEREREALVGARLTDEQWVRVSMQLPAPKREGRPRADDRQTLDGILYVLRTGCRWHDLPAEYGSAVTCWRRLARWEADGTWERVWRALFSTLTTREKLAWARAFLSPARGPRPHRRQRRAPAEEAG